MNSVMLPLRLLIAVALIVQLLWAQGGLLLPMPCPKRAQAAPAPRQVEAPTKTKGCCRLKARSDGRGGCRMRAALAAAPAPDVEPNGAAKRACTPTRCRNCPAQRSPRPVDRIPAGQKSAPPPPAVPPPISSLVEPPRCASHGRAKSALPLSNVTRRAALCVWRN